MQCIRQDVVGQDRVELLCGGKKGSRAAEAFTIPGRESALTGILKEAFVPRQEILTGLHVGCKVGLGGGAKLCIGHHRGQGEDTKIFERKTQGNEAAMQFAYEGVSNFIAGILEKGWERMR